MNIEKIITADGSSSLSLVGQNEHYHSTHGAIQEAKHVYLASGLDYFFNSHHLITKANILEVGFGTGLNALLSLLFATQNKIALNYTSIEAYPLKWEVVKDLNYPELLDLSHQQFQLLHDLPWNRFEKVKSYFSLRKIEIKLEEIDFMNEFDVVFFDAFGPRTQPELWEKPIFKKIYKAMKTPSVFVTYSAKGQVRRNLKEVGFEVEKISGPPGKREMLRARKTKV